MKTPLVVGTESLAFPDRETRDAEWTRLRAKNVKGVSRRTDQIDGRMLYVVSWPKSEQLVLDQNEAEVLLREAQAVVNVGKGGNTNELDK